MAYLNDYMFHTPEGVHIGRVMRFLGEPAATRWCAFAPDPAVRFGHLRAGFRTRRSAEAWLNDRYAASGQSVSQPSDFD